MSDRIDDLAVSERIVAEYIDGLRDSFPRTTSHIDTGPGVLPTVSRSLGDFFCEVATVLNDYQARKNIAERDRVKLTEEHPPKDLQSQIITYRLIHSTPGNVARGRPGVDMSSSARHEWVAQARYIQDNPEQPNSRTVVMGQFMDNVIEFTCWARTNKAANHTAELFHDLLGIYRFYFKLKGFPEVLFQERLEDITLDSTIQDSLKGRPLRYYVRIDRTFRIYEPMLRDIVLNLALSNS